MLLQDVPVVAAHNAPVGALLRFENRTQDYAELARHCRQLSHALSTLAPAGARVAVVSGNRLEFVACCFAIPGARQIMVPLNIRLSPRELAEQLEDAEPSVVLAEAEFVETLAPLIADLGGRLGSPIELIVLGGRTSCGRPYDEWLADSEGMLAPALPEPHEDDPAWILFTSGTTGRAKGAVLTHRNLMTGSYSMMMASDAGRRETVLFQFPMFHISAYTLIWFLLRGYSLHIVRSFEASRCLASIEQYRISMMSIAPTMLAMLLDHPEFGSRDTTSLRLLTYGSSAMPLEVIRRAMSHWPQASFGTAFGMTELAGNVLYQDCIAHRRSVEGAPHLLSSCGRPMALSRVRLLNDDGTDAAPGEAGEIAVRGQQVFAGYWRNPVATQASFRDGWFLTGDIARRDGEGFYYIIDRKKDMIISGGENVYSREVENVLYQHPAVAEAAVIGLPDATWGERVTAVVRLREQPSAQIVEQLDGFSRTRMAGFKRPRRWIIVDDLPKTAAGKIQKADLRVRLARGDLRCVFDSDREGSRGS